MPLPERRYLGDSVYAEIESGMIKLTTENGEGPSNTIYLEPSVMQALDQFFQDAVVAVAAAAVHPPGCHCDACTCARCGNPKHEGQCHG